MIFGRLLSSCDVGDNHHIERPNTVEMIGAPMIVSHITLKNWRNFQSVDVDMGNRVFLVGPNASYL